MEADQRRDNQLKQLEATEAQSHTSISLKAYGEFLQCIPRPGEKPIFITLQGEVKTYSSKEQEDEKKLKEDKKQAEEGNAQEEIGPQGDNKTEKAPVSSAKKK